MREPGLVVEGVLEAPPEEKLGGKVGVYRSVFIEKVWALDELLKQPIVTNGAVGLPGENPRNGPKAAKEHEKLQLRKMG